MAELMHPKKHGKRSTRPRGKNSTTWGALPSSGKEISKREDGGDAGMAKKITPSRVSKRIQKLREIKSGANAQVAAIRTEITGCIDPKNRGRRSVRPRGNMPASWVSMDGFQTLDVVVSKLGNVQEVVSKKMKSCHGDTASCNATKDEAKVKEHNGADLVQADVAVADTLPDVKEGIRAPMTATSVEVNGSGANGTEQNGVTIPDTSFEAKDSNHADAIAAVERVGLVMTDTTAELKVKLSIGADAKFVVQAGVPMTSTSAESNGEMANALVKSAVQTTDAADPQQGKANDAEFDSRTFSGLDLGHGDCNVFLSSAESALASLYGQYDKYSCIEFAIKLLMNEIPLPKEAEEVEEFFVRTMNGDKVTSALLGKPDKL